MSNESTKCLIIGSGPAGYTAAIYASRANISPILYEGIMPGGQLTTTSEVENFPGYPEGVMGAQLMDDLRKQAERFGADIRPGIITKVDFSKRPFTAVADDNTTIVADTVIIATGASATLFRSWCFSLCHLRRLLLSRTHCGCCRRRRYSLRRSLLSQQSRSKGISDCA